METEVCQVFVSLDPNSVLRLGPHLFHQKSVCFVGAVHVHYEYDVLCYFHGSEHFIISFEQSKILLMYNCFAYAYFVVEFIKYIKE